MLMVILNAVVHGSKIFHGMYSQAAEAVRRQRVVAVRCRNVKAIEVCLWKADRCPAGAHDVTEYTQATIRVAQAQLAPALLVLTAAQGFHPFGLGLCVHF